MTKTAVLLCAAIFSGSLDAAQLKTLLASADAIVTGTQSAAAWADHRFTFNLRVERVFRGTMQKGATLTVVWNSRMNPYAADAVPSYRGIWFLRATADGNWECIPAGASGNATFFPELSLPLSELPLPSQLAYDVNTTPLADQIILEMAAGVVAGAPRPNKQMILWVAAEMNSPGILQAFRYLADCQAVDQVSMGTAGLVQRNDTSGLLLAESLAVRLGTGLFGPVISAVSDFRGTDPVAIESLRRIAISGQVSPFMRDAAMRALGRSGIRDY